MGMMGRMQMKRVEKGSWVIGCLLLLGFLNFAAAIVSSTDLEAVGWSRENEEEVEEGGSLEEVKGGEVSNLDVLRVCIQNSKEEKLLERWLNCLESVGQAGDDGEAVVISQEEEVSKVFGRVSEVTTKKKRQFVWESLKKVRRFIGQHNVAPVSDRNPETEIVMSSKEGDIAGQIVIAMDSAFQDNGDMLESNGDMLESRDKFDSDLSEDFVSPDERVTHIQDNEVDPSNVPGMTVYGPDGGDPDQTGTFANLVEPYQPPADIGQIEQPDEKFMKEPIAGRNLDHDLGQGLTSDIDTLAQRTHTRLMCAEGQTSSDGGANSAVNFELQDALKIVAAVGAITLVLRVANRPGGRIFPGVANIRGKKLNAGYEGRQSSDNLQNCAKSLSVPIGMAVATVIFEVLEQVGDDKTRPSAGVLLREVQSTDVKKMVGMWRETLHYLKVTFAPKLCVQLLEVALKESLLPTLGTNHSHFVDSFKQAFSSSYKTMASVRHSFRKKHRKNSSSGQRSKSLSKSGYRIFVPSSLDSCTEDIEVQHGNSVMEAVEQSSLKVIEKIRSKSFNFAEELQMKERQHDLEGPSYEVEESDASVSSNVNQSNADIQLPMKGRVEVNEAKANGNTNCEQDVWPSENLDGLEKQQVNAEKTCAEIVAVDDLLDDNLKVLKDEQGAQQRDTVCSKGSSRTSRRREHVEHNTLGRTSTSRRSNGAGSRRQVSETGRGRDKQVYRHHGSQDLTSSAPLQQDRRRMFDWSRNESSDDFANRSRKLDSKYLQFNALDQSMKSRDQDLWVREAGTAKQDETLIERERSSESNLSDGGTESNHLVQESRELPLVETAQLEGVSMQETMVLASSAFASGVSENGFKQALLHTLAKSVKAQEAHNYIKSVEVAHLVKCIHLEEEKNQLTSESLSMKREKLDLGHFKAKFKESEVQDRILSRAHFELSKTCADELVAGLCVMIAAISFSAWKFSYSRLSRAIYACQPPIKETAQAGWLGTNWLYNSLNTLTWQVQSLVCELYKAGNIVLGLLVLFIITSALIRRGVTGSSQAMPTTIIIVVLGGVGGFLGKIVIDSLGGSGYHWLLMWEALCLLHVLATCFTPLLFVLLHGTPTRPYQEVASIWSRLISFLRKFFFHATIVFVLPAMAGLLPFASIEELVQIFIGYSVPAVLTRYEMSFM